MDAEEDGEEGEEEAEEADAKEENNSFLWFSLIDEVSTLVHCSWDDVFNKNVIEFFNILSYNKEKNRRIKAEQEKWMKK